MKTNQTGIDLIKHFEGLHDGDLSLIGLQPKMCPAGIWTQGYGRAMRVNGQFLKGWLNKDVAFANATIKTEEEAEAALKVDLLKFEKIVLGKLKVSVNENQFAALVSHTYNTGGSDTLFRYVNKCASDRLIREWIENRYTTAGGVFLKGLKARRKAESYLFFKPIN